jgi:hypothetical protein
MEDVGYIFCQLGICILQPFGMFYGNLVYFWKFGIFSGYLANFLVIWYIFWLFGIFFRFSML